MASSSEQSGSSGSISGRPGGRSHRERWLACPRVLLRLIPPQGHIVRAASPAFISRFGIPSWHLSVSIGLVSIHRGGRLFRAAGKIAGGSEEPGATRVGPSEFERGRDNYPVDNACRIKQESEGSGERTRGKIKPQHPGFPRGPPPWY